MIYIWAIDNINFFFLSLLSFHLFDCSSPGLEEGWGIYNILKIKIFFNLLQSLDPVVLG
jgi:hypothetical protein